MVYGLHDKSRKLRAAYKAVVPTPGRQVGMWPPHLTSAGPSAPPGRGTASLLCGNRFQLCPKSHTRPLPPTQCKSAELAGLLTFNVPSFELKSCFQTLSRRAVTNVIASHNKYVPHRRYRLPLDFFFPFFLWLLHVKKNGRFMHYCAL